MIPSDNVIVTGYTNGSLFGTNQGSNDVFVVKYSTNGSQVWAKQFGGVIVIMRSLSRWIHRIM